MDSQSAHHHPLSIILSLSLYNIIIIIIIIHSFIHCLSSKYEVNQDSSKGVDLDYDTYLVRSQRDDL